jgi:hypothetical protein
MEIFFILWAAIFVVIIAMIIKKGSGKGKYKSSSINDTKTALDEDMFTDPAWKSSSFNMFH